MVALGALVVSFISLSVAVLALSRKPDADRHVMESDLVPGDVEGLRREVAALREETSDSLRHLSVVRYDAFGDMGGHLSWSMALLDDKGHGVVLTSIHGRSEARTYAKNISSWSCEQQLSPEEEDAIAHARPQ